MKKVVVITGASSGIGEATAKILAKDYIVVLAARREERLKALAKEINDLGGEAIYQITDVTRKDDVERLKDVVLKKFKRIDVWINNAGIMLMSWLEERQTTEWEKMIDVNIKGLLYGVACALEVMQKQKSGQIINIASVASLNVSPGNIVYCATKHFVKAINDGLREELAIKQKNIKVTGIYPGVITTEINEHIQDKASKDYIDQYYRDNGAIPAIRVAKVILEAIEMDEDTVLNDIVIRPIKEIF